jgi:hypothetical protein
MGRMPARPTLPADDLYGRLGVPDDASAEAIEVAWRGLLRKHHPDIAGPDALELAKRINIAHDWLSDPELRRRYDRERGTSIRSGRRPRAPVERWGWTPPRTTPRRPPTTEERVAAVIERIGRLTRDDLDRLARAEPAPIAFLATLRRFVDVELQATLDAAERAALDALPRAARTDPAIHDAIAGRLADIILGDVLDELLGDPAGARARERLTRGWDAAVGQPRYGPATSAVEELLATLGSMDAAALRWLAGTGGRDRLGEAPWPDATSPDEDDALRVSTELAAADAAAAIVDGSAAARRAAARVGHLLVLRHAFPAAVFDRHAAPWLGRLIPSLAPAPKVRPRR